MLFISIPDIVPALCQENAAASPRPSLSYPITLPPTHPVSSLLGPVLLQYLAMSYFSCLRPYMMDGWVCTAMGMTELLSLAAPASALGRSSEKTSKNHDNWSDHQVMVFDLYHEVMV